MWSSALQTAFDAAKAALVAAVPLLHPDASAVLSLAVDPSSSHVGAVLQQGCPGKFRPQAFFSKNLSPAQRNYSTFDPELLAAFSAVRHFRSLLEGRSFRLYTDHKPLVSALACVSPPWSARRQRQLSYLAEFTSDLCNVPGADNSMADCLSRPEPPGVLSTVLSGLPSARGASPGPGDSVCPLPGDRGPISYPDMAATQLWCAGVAALHASPLLIMQSVPFENFFLLCDVSTGVPQPLVPDCFQRVVFDVLHVAGHPGV